MNNRIVLYPSVLAMCCLLYGTTGICSDRGRAVKYHVCIVCVECDTYVPIGVEQIEDKCLCEYDTTGTEVHEFFRLSSTNMMVKKDGKTVGDVDMRISIVNIDDKEKLYIDRYSTVFRKGVETKMPKDRVLVLYRTLYEELTKIESVKKDDKCSLVMAEFETLLRSTEGGKKVNR